MENIDNLLLKKVEVIFKDVKDLGAIVDYNKILHTKWDNDFINSYIDEIKEDKYDHVLEKSVQLCSLSYMTNENIKRILNKAKATVIYSKDFEKSKYYILYNKQKNNIIITFRGTSYLSNALLGLEYYRTDFDFISEQEKKKFIMWRNKKIYKNRYFDQKTVPLKEDVDIEIHKGYYQESMEMLNFVMNDLLELIGNQDTHIVFVGHSMGIIGNIVSLLFKIRLCQYKLLNNKLDKIKLYNITINSPTIGNKNYNLLKFYYGINKTIQFFNDQDKLIKYGYYRTIFDEKKIRHTEYMLKGNYAIVDKNLYINLDYGDYIEKIFEKLKKYDKINNELLFFHSLFKIRGHKKLLFI